MISSRLVYQPVAPAHLDVFHGLVQDQHIRRYLMDGNLFPPQWTEERIRDSQSLFERRGVGIWLAFERIRGELVGFCGFLEILALHAEPQLVYALLERFSGNGYATEIADTSIAYARLQGFTEVFAGVDEINTVSVHILRKLGFEWISIQQGHFGNSFLFRLG